MDRSASSLLFLVLSVAVSSAAAHPQDYWKKVLPDTPMPRAVVDLLRPDVLGTKGTDYRVNAGLPLIFFRYAPAATQNEDHRDRAATLNEVRRNPQARFFLEEDLHPGSKMKFDFGSSTPATAFAPRALTDAMPFSTVDLPKILARFSLKPNSKEEVVMKKTLQLCESQAMAGETKYCATSLESMVDFVTYSLGTSVRAVSMVGKVAMNKLQDYTVVSVGHSLAAVGDKSVSCHKLSYPYAVFYCHATSGTTTAYMVPLVREDGDKVAAVAVCHHDTSGWNPEHIAFQMLKVKPGTVAICHFLPQDQIFWAARKAMKDLPSDLVVP